VAEAKARIFINNVHSTLHEYKIPKYLDYHQRHTQFKKES
jgi:hypothetical protein